MIQINIKGTQVNIENLNELYSNKSKKSFLQTRTKYILFQQSDFFHKQKSYCSSISNLDFFCQNEF
ncbi:hypothetical protein pb186bvf_014453 [Paramecium bursaria]